MKDISGFNRSRGVHSAQHRGPRSSGNSIHCTAVLQMAQRVGNSALCRTEHGTVVPEGSRIGSTDTKTHRCSSPVCDTVWGV